MPRSLLSFIIVVYSGLRGQAVGVAHEQLDSTSAETRTRSRHSTGASEHTEAKPGISKYEFKTAVPNHMFGVHVIYIEFVGARGSDVKMVPVKAGQYCVNGAKKSTRNQKSFSGLVKKHGPGWYLACSPPQPKVGQLLYAITAPTKVNEIKIKWSRPKYAPGLEIYRDGKLLLKETKNRGEKGTPTPVTYSYRLGPKKKKGAGKWAIVNHDCQCIKGRQRLAVAKSPKDCQRKLDKAGARFGYMIQSARNAAGGECYKASTCDLCMSSPDKTITVLGKN